MTGIENKLKDANFGDKVRILRAVRDLSQRDLEKMTGISTRYISNIENGLIHPNSEWINRLKCKLQWPAHADLAFAILEGKEAGPVIAEMLAELEQVWLAKPEMVKGTTT